MTDQNTKISLSFNKKIENKKLPNSALNKNSEVSYGHTDTGLKHSILSFDKYAQVYDPQKQKEIIIPLVQTNRDAVFSRLKKKSQDAEVITGTTTSTASTTTAKEKTLDEKAVEAIIKESSEEFILNKKSKSDLSIEQIPSTSTSTRNSLFEDTGSISTLENYDQVKVEDFGAAMLRGMGWKPGKGIGITNKRVIDVIDPPTRSFALTNDKKENTKVKTEEELDLEDQELKKGIHVLIHSGRNRGTYGVIETVDEDHILVRPARGDRVLREVEHNVKVVSPKEYKELSRVINKEMYDEFKAAENRKKEKRKNADKAENKEAKRRRENKANDRESKAKDKTYADDTDKCYENMEEIKAEREERSEKERRLLYNKLLEKVNKASSDNSEYKREKETPVSDNSEYKKEINFNDNEYKRKTDSDSGYKREKELNFSDNEYKRKKDSDSEYKREKEGSSTENDGYKRENEKGYSDNGGHKREKQRYSDNIEYNRENEKGYYSDKGPHKREKERYSDNIEYNRENEKVSSNNNKYKKEKDISRKETKESKTKEKSLKHRDEFKSNKKVKDKLTDQKFSDSHKLSQLPVIPWARENLRVRIIDKDYKGGKYHKEKVIVCSVETVDNCTCRTNDGKILYDVNPDRLETVIPKGQSDLIFIVKGKYKGEKGRILELDKEREKAVIQLLGESSVILKLYYEDICEYVR